jgi:hypothetical protein
MNPEDSSPHLFARVLPAGLAVGILLLLAWWLRTPRQAAEPASSAGVAVEASSPDIEVPAPSPGSSQVAAAPAASLAEGPVPLTLLPGHEGHGDECAECVAERKLAVYREDYAQLELAQALRGRVLPADQSTALQAACRQLSMAVVKRWSFSESRPLLAEDSAVEDLRRKILQPLIELLPPAAEDSP